MESYICPKGWKPEYNFWKENPECLLISEFRLLYDTDKSKHKEKSSTIMYGIYVVEDYYCKFSYLPYEERLKIAYSLVLKDISIDLKVDPYRSACTRYIELQQDSPRRYLSTFIKEVEQMRLFMEDTPWEKTTWEMKQRLLLNAEKILQQEKNIKEMISEQESLQLKGGTRLTAFAQGQLNVENNVEKRTKGLKSMLSNSDKVIDLNIFMNEG